MQRSLHQYRPKGDPNGMIYAPQRDIANLYTPMLREVFQGLDENNWPPVLRAMFEAHGIDNDKLSAAVKVIVDAHRLFIRDRSISSPADAFAKAGIDTIDPIVKMAVFERLGEVMMGGFFVALRDVTEQGALSAVHTDFVDMLAAGRTLAEKLSDHRINCDYDFALEKAQEEAAETQRALTQSQVALEECRCDLYQVTQERDAYRKRLEDAKPVLDHTTQITDAGWWTRVYRVLVFAAKLYFTKKP
jgi:hypothetical protein